MTAIVTPVENKTAPLVNSTHGCGQHSQAPLILVHVPVTGTVSRDDVGHVGIGLVPSVERTWSRSCRIR